VSQDGTRKRAQYHLSLQLAQKSAGVDHRFHKFAQSDLSLLKIEGGLPPARGSMSRF
jgi:hypothetical protein